MKPGGGQAIAAPARPTAAKGAAVAAAAPACLALLDPAANTCRSWADHAAASGVDGLMPARPRAGL